MKITVEKIAAMCTTNKPREFFIVETLDGQIFIFREYQSGRTKFIEAGPVLEKIARLEAVLKKCKEKSMELIRYHSNERFDSIDAEECEKELESILDGLG